MEIRVSLAMAASGGRKQEKAGTARAPAPADAGPSASALLRALRALRNPTFSRPFL